jgi:hypothetical protein
MQSYPTMAPGLYLGFSLAGSQGKAFRDLTGCSTIAVPDPQRLSQGLSPMEHEVAQFEQAQDYLSQIEGDLKERVWSAFFHPLVTVMAPNGAEPHRQVLLDGRTCVEDYATWSYHWVYDEKGQFLPEKSFVGISLLGGTDDPDYPNNFLFADMMFPQGEGILLTPDKLEGLEMLRKEFVHTNAHFDQAEFRIFYG